MSGRFLLAYILTSFLYSLEAGGSYILVNPPLLVALGRPCALKSFSKKKQEEAEQGKLRPKTKPDADNYAKGILDAMKGIIWQDDGQVTDLIARKYYSERPRVEVAIRAID
ncbi:RusA family crossover junction endodeoxyribonuclease [Enterococcus cecorum]|uniref:RusA family crossover junction endodeoxyribonuclease n=1 Tax=Enterococcus cecorum TaxID=44008 RepID=UPI003266D1A7